MCEFTSVSATTYSSLVSNRPTLSLSRKGNKVGYFRDPSLVSKVFDKTTQRLSSQINTRYIRQVTDSNNNVNRDYGVAYTKYSTIVSLKSEFPDHKVGIHYRRIYSTRIYTMLATATETSLNDQIKQRN